MKRDWKQKEETLTVRVGQRCGGATHPRKGPINEGCASSGAENKEQSTVSSSTFKEGELRSGAWVGKRG